ncbi:putative LRR receptor-like serine/threonine-protein kinase [Citrus sinensis]|uniref:LRR receptor-like serine/threonine-protein kinase n=1 Tax=Citrus sinensis TaxID=2711 RepID=A0ACB8M157_CITSI|nr:putative LRR receptor-like serine/threonine-protein kinase [Citrus sinensis]
MGKIVSVFVVLGFLVLNCFANFGSHAQRLPDDEVQTLQSIFRKLNFRNGQVNQTSCTEGSWNVTIDDSNGSNFTCDCTYSNNTVCHVTVILLKGFNLAGVIPEEFGNLTFLQEVDLSRNYFNGSLPKSFARLQNLTKLLILGNRLSGSIPLEIGDISTLEELVLEDNQLVGPLPENLGNLKSLRRILLSSNNFTGSIPESYGNLKNLTEFRIDGSNLTGRIPNFIGNWTKLDRLDLQGTSLEGPIPSTISQLKNLTELRISDLKGSSSSFPNLQDMKKMERLDLSFNQLTGPVPGILQNLKKIDYIFLTNNSLSGTLPDWILTSEKNLCSMGKFLAGIYPTTTLQSHLPLLAESPEYVFYYTFFFANVDYSLFINCGGSPTEFEENDYEEDLNTQGPSNFGIVSDRWAYSSTGVYVGNESSTYLAANQYGLNVSGAEYYKTARLAPQSLKYYGLCMLKGSYTVKLHFAEIMFTNDQTYKSLGKRMFDVSIQGKQVLKDFDIMEEAGGVGIGITREFKDVSVNGSTMEIHLYWAGKGTNAIPYRGVYGPLISAITVTPNFEVDTGGGLSAGAIVGIVAGSCAVVIILLFILWRLGYLGGKNVEDKELRGLDLQTGYFTLRQIKAATNNFDAANKIGEGGFGPVYKGTLSDGAVIAVKQLSSKSKQGNREFVNEIGMISALQHQNLVKLYGCCIEGNQLLLVYEYLENNSLARALFGKEGQCLNLDWATRKRICSDIARGLAYLHEESRLKIVHRDIKATNVLLDKDLNAKISDFGLAKLDEDENTHISTRIAGTVGYMAPEYAMRGYLTDKADVYSFGIVALEIVSGKSNTNYRPKEEFVYLLDWAYVLQEQGNLLELVDPSLGSNFSKKEAMTMLNIALLCTNPSPTLRPTMSSVVSMLEGKTAVQAPIIRRNSDSQDARFRAFEILSQDSQTHVSTLSQESEMQRTMSIDAPWTDSSVSVQIPDETREHSSSSLLLQNENNL